MHLACIDSQHNSVPCCPAVSSFSECRFVKISSSFILYSLFLSSGDASTDAHSKCLFKMSLCNEVTTAELTKLVRGAFSTNAFLICRTSNFPVRTGKDHSLLKIKTKKAAFSEANLNMLYRVNGRNKPTKCFIQ